MNLGDKVRDTITGLTGTVIARTEWLNGCVRLLVQPNELKDGEPVKSTSVDIEQLVLVEAKDKSEKKPTGGDRPTPTRHADPTR